MLDIQLVGVEIRDMTPCLTIDRSSVATSSRISTGMRLEAFITGGMSGFKYMRSFPGNIPIYPRKLGVDNIASGDVV